MPGRSPSTREGAVVAAVALGTVLAPLNTTMIAVALPQIADDFDVSVGTVSWLVTGYLVASVYAATRARLPSGCHSAGSPDDSPTTKSFRVRPGETGRPASC